MSDVLIAPSVLAADFAVLGEQVREAELAGADWFHIDVMDGHFVPAISFGAPVVRGIRGVTSLPLDVHLMIDSVDSQLEAFVSAGANSITVHVEAISDPAATLRKIRELGVRPGLTLRPTTSVDEVLPYLDLIDILLVMTVEPGLGGQELLPEMLPRIELLSGRLRQIPGESILVVDGGLNESTITQAVSAGAQVIVAGSAVFGATDGISAALARLRVLTSV
ncbi:MAG: ribulose-phosphate 3-epimerase [Chloroflexi bacterium]|nr:ribulose-phosphate 3-epimerase [Chloroflexota bacterium]|tara:strand:- start:8192 stop:8857 length:666 start_codon:yes stop_codon:yes gene_type:complete